MTKSEKTISKTAYWSGKHNGYFFDRSAQAVLNDRPALRKERVRVAQSCGSCEPCSCGIGACGSGGGCDSY